MEQTYPPGKNNQLSKPPIFSRDRAAYLLFRFRIAVIKTQADDMRALPAAWVNILFPMGSQRNLLNDKNR